ncbi:cytosine permease [Lactovum miscens]|uniref:NCS1 family nucleobase:cation symporter-1 n=1 Tax=Lactovum miscens TaxID=190387 RepID=A0A841CB22_9LACT|nr:cytosine permease [Lactovum miscens]MBB5888752.1 NCS1 family nucleobase:cation symporter-1 [Lactovum miscens]
MENMQINSEARTTGSWDSFATWINANANNSTWFTGGVIVASGIWVASWDLIIVGLLSYAFMTVSAYMGYKTGLPSMYLTRPSFGIRGSILPSFINIIQFMGWAAANTFIAALSMAMILHSIFGLPDVTSKNSFLSVGLGIFIMMILHILAVSLGEKSIRLLQRFGVWLIYILVIWELIVVFKNFSIHQLLSWRPSAKIKMPIGTAIETMAVFNLGWATAGSDFSRFSKNKISGLLLPFIGINIGTWWFAAVGMLSTVAMAISLNRFDPNNSDPSAVATKLGLGIVALLVIVVTSTASNAVSLLAAGSAYNNIFKKQGFNKSLMIVTIFASVISFIPVFASSFLNAFMGFLTIIGMTLIPVIPIYLLDFYVIKKRKYDVREFDKVKGKYWYNAGVNWIAIISWMVGVGAYNFFAQWTAVSSTVGMSFETLIVTGIVYYLLTKICILIKERRKND